MSGPLLFPLTRTTLIARYLTCVNVRPIARRRSERHPCRHRPVYVANARGPPDCLGRASHQLQDKFLVTVLPYDAGGTSAFISMPQGDRQAPSEERRLHRCQRLAYKHTVHGAASGAGAGALVGVAAHVGSGSLPLPVMDFSPPPTCSLPRWARGPRCRLA